MWVLLDPSQQEPSADTGVPTSEPSDGNDGQEAATFDLSVRMADHSGEVTLSGDLDIASAPRLGETFDWLCDQGCEEVTVDVADVSFVDSSGLAAFVRAHQTLQRCGGRLTLRRPGHSMRRLLEMTGLTSEFHIQ